MRRPWFTGGCHAKNKNYDDGLKNKIGRTEVLGPCNLLKIHKIKVVLNVVISPPSPTPHELTASQLAKASSLFRLHDNTQKHNAWYDSSGRVISPSRNTQHLMRDRHICIRRNSNPKSQQASGRRSTP